MRYTFAKLLICLAFLVGCDAPKARSEVTVLDFYTTWCAPCRRDKPAVDKLQGQGVRIIRYDAEKQEELAKRYNVVSYPTYVVLKGGKEIFRTNRVNELGRHVK